MSTDPDLPAVPDSADATRTPLPTDGTAKTDTCPRTGVPMRYCTCTGPHTAHTAED